MNEQQMSTIVRKLGYRAAQCDLLAANQDLPAKIRERAKAKAKLIREEQLAAMENNGDTKPGMFRSLFASPNLRGA